MATLDEFIAEKVKEKSGSVPSATSSKKTTPASNTATSALKTIQEPGKQRILAPAATLKSTGGLTALAGRAGLTSDVERILSKKGEDPSKYFSGGMITDIFDVLNTLQYGVTGVLKGKGFAEGVRTRQSFSDQDALGQYGIPGLIAGIALDIAVDPLTWIAPATIASKLGKVSKLAKATKAVNTAVGASRVGQFLGSRFVYRFGQDPVYRLIDERRIKNIGVATQNLIELVRPISKMDAPTQQAITAARKAGKLDSLAPEVLEKARPVYEALDALGKKAVDAGLLDEATWAANVGKYLPRLYRTHEVSSDAEKALDAVKGVFASKPTRIDLSRFKKLGDIPDDVRKAMGEIQEAAYPTAKAFVQLTHAVENATFFREVSQKFGRETLEEGFEALPKTARLGELSGKSVPKFIADSINEIARAKTGIEKFQAPIVGGFKFAKVILNPATHARNVASNMVLNSWEGMNPLDPRTLHAYGIAAKEIATGGKWATEARQVGLGLDTFASAEIRGFLDMPELNKLGKASSKVKGAMNKLADLYEGEEKFAKLAQYIFQRQTKGLSPEEAWKVAERATFNYAQVTPFIRRMRESLFGYPFITFTYKATPQAVKTAYKNPTRISNIGKLKAGIENQTNQEELSAERASEPQWVKDGFYVKLPIKDKEGRSAYFDLTYILPFGDLVSGQYLERSLSRETGLPVGPGQAIAEKLPLFQVISTLVRNQDFYGNKVFKESDPVQTQLGDVMRELTKTYMPPTVGDLIPGGYKSDGSRQPAKTMAVVNQARGITEGGTQTRTIMQELLRNVGVKINPVDLMLQQKYADYERQKALTTLLEEAGIIKKFQVKYTPKK